MYLGLIYNFLFSFILEGGDLSKNNQKTWMNEEEEEGELKVTD